MWVGVIARWGAVQHATAMCIRGTMQHCGGFSLEVQVCKLRNPLRNGFLPNNTVFDQFIYFSVLRLYLRFLACNIGQLFDSIYCDYLMHDVNLLCRFTATLYPKYLIANFLNKSTTEVDFWDISGAFLFIANYLYRRPWCSTCVIFIHDSIAIST